MQAIAAFNAVTRVDDFAFTPQQSIATAITTYIAQNRGANQKERIRPGFRVGIRLELCYWLLVGQPDLGCCARLSSACLWQGRVPPRS